MMGYSDVDTVADTMPSVVVIVFELIPSIIKTDCVVITGGDNDNNGGERDQREQWVL